MARSKFSSYADIDDVKQLKAVWDFNFVDPKAAGIALNNIGALLKATADFGPHEVDPLKVVVVTHGPELAVFAKVNYSKYKEIVDRAASFSQQGVRFEACRNAAAAQGFRARRFPWLHQRGPGRPICARVLAGQGLLAERGRRHHADTTDQRVEQGRHSQEMKRGVAPWL